MLPNVTIMEGNVLKKFCKSCDSYLCYNLAETRFLRFSVKLRAFYYDRWQKMSKIHVRM